MDKPLPVNYDIEKNILGAILIEPELINLAVSFGVSSSSFYDGKHSYIYKAMLMLKKQKQEHIDIITINDTINGKYGIDESFLMDIQSKIATTAGFKDWCSGLLRYKALRLLINESNKTIHHCYYRDIDIDEIIKNQRTSIETAKNLSEIKPNLSTKDKVLKAHKQITELMNGTSTDVVPYCLFGFSELFRHKKGQMHVLAARPGCGKTALMLSCMLEKIKQGYVDAIFCHESTSSEIIQRLICMESGITLRDVEDFKTWNQNKVEKYKKSINFLKDNSDKFYIFGAGDYAHNPDGIRYEIKKIQDETNNKLCSVTVDYFQNLKPPLGFKKSRVEMYEDFALEISNVFKDYQVAGTLLSQLNRPQDKYNYQKKPNEPNENKQCRRFSMYDLKWCSMLEQEAAFVTFLQREGEEGEHIPVNFYSDKFRDSTKLDTILDFNTFTGKFYGVRHKYDENYYPEEY